MNIRIPYRSLILSLIVIAVSIWLDQPNHSGINVGSINRDISTRLGLDLIGGIQTLLEADVSTNETVTAEAMNTARNIVERRVNGLGVTEAVVQLAGDRRIVVELPGVDDPEEAVATIKGTALLEFVDFSAVPQQQAIELVGTQIQTDFGLTETSLSELTDLPANGGIRLGPNGVPVFNTVMTGAELNNAFASQIQVTGESVVSFELTDEGAQIFADFTTANVGEILAIVLDKEVISVPQINSPITEGAGIIEGNFTIESANQLAVQLGYGALPVPLRVVETRIVGPTLGQDSLQKSLVAGAVGISIVMLFMVLYYRLPGFVAILSLLAYGSIILALFRTIPVTLTLAGIAGLMLGTGSTLDANILIYERLKEELRAGKSLRNALELCWDRAWPSIRDSNIATIITSLILLWFGSTFGATVVQGFALTLLLGVGVSLFTAITVTRSFLGTVLALYQPKNYELWFGI